MTERRPHAVVLGASMGGLLAARALSSHFDRVTIVERDGLPDEAAVRKGVPQSAHAHGLLASGYRIMDGYFPGMMDELEAGGAPRGDVVGNFLWFQYGHWKLRHEAGLRGITVSRPCLESAIRQRVKAIRNVRFVESTTAVKPVFDPAAGRVIGVVIRRHEPLQESTLAADLVVDASGRGSQSPKWLEEWGFKPPDTLVVKVNVGYATRIFARSAGEFFDSMGGLIAGSPPANSRYGAVLAAEGPRWVVTLVGSMGDYPPDTIPEWNAFAATLPVPAVHELVSTATPLSDIRTYRFPANQRQLYERLARFPDGYLVIGDALCSFNPIYGQGMSVAASEAKALEESEPSRLEGLARRFYARAASIVDIPWQIATGEDLRFPQVEGTRPRGFHIVNRYLDRVHAMASADAAVCRRFFDVLNLLAPPTALMSPAMAWRVLAHRLPREPGTPWGIVARGDAPRATH
jgi:2-polyprenyl-6-methoxyphenol hydroxylase-like FAD-dependent oxidoreductase